MLELIHSAMPNGDRQTIINPVLVKDALKRVRLLDVEVQNSALEWLTLVDQVLAQFELPLSSNDRRLALNTLLADVVHQNYIASRAVFGLVGTPQANPSRADILNAIAEDSKASGDSMALLGWAWLYYHYIVETLSISQEDFAKAASVAVRTVRRHSRDAVALLATRLTQMELSARARRTRNRLLRRLPHYGAGDLIGRDSIVNRMVHVCGENEYSIFHIIGPPGVGKSSIAEAVIRRIIDQSIVDRLVWIQHPLSPEYVRHFVRQELLGEGSAARLEDILISQSVVVVIDDVDILITSSEFPRLLVDLYNARCIILTGSLRLLLRGVVQVPIRELDYSQSLSIFNRVVSRQPRPTFVGVDEAVFDQVWDTVGGNPLAIELLVNGLQVYGDASLSQKASVEQLYAVMYGKCSEQERLIWLLVAIGGSFRLDWFVHPSVNVERAIANLVQLSIVNPHPLEPGRYALCNAARTFILLRYNEDPGLSQALQETVQAWANVRENEPLQVPAYLVAMTLGANWAMIPTPVKRRLALRYWRSGLMGGQWVIWITILESLCGEAPVSDTDICLGYVMCLRSAGQFDRATEILVSASQLLGESGYFELQTEFMVERAVLARLCGEIDLARNTLEKAIAIHQGTQAHNHLSTRIEAEWLQLSVEQCILTEAREHLSSIHALNWRTALEVQMNLIGNMSKASDRLETVGGALQQLMLDELSSTGFRVRYHALAAWLEGVRGNTAEAVVHWQLALARLEDAGPDPFLQARLETNLAGDLIRGGDLDSAQELLLHAARLQIRLRDRIGFAFTQVQYVLLRKNKPV